MAIPGAVATRSPTQAEFRNRLSAIESLVHHGRLDAGVNLITKPFSYADLAAKVRDMLDSA